MPTKRISQILKNRQKYSSVLEHANSARICSEFNKLIKEKDQEQYDTGARAASFKEGTLTIRVKNYAQAQYFYFQAYAWQEVFNESWGKDVIKEIKVKQY